MGSSVSKGEYQRTITLIQDSNSVSKRDLLWSLNCIVCQEVMEPPILMCRVGHDLCSECRKRINKCPLCNSPYDGTRNFYAEGLVTELQKNPCMFADEGCTAVLPIDFLEVHQQKCPFGTCKCEYILDNGETCNWHDKIGKLPEHVTSTHGSDVLEGSENRKSFEYTFQHNSKESLLVSAFGELFWWHRKCVLEDGLYEAFRCIGALNKSKKYKYELSYSDQTPAYKNSIKVTCEEEFNSLCEKKDCSYKQIQDCRNLTRNNMLEVHYKIAKI